MGWETRGNREYYYRKRRDGEKVISQYVGAGSFAALIARADELDRERHREALIAERKAQEADLALDRQVNQACDLVRTMTAAELLSKGYHTHKGQWRKKRGSWL